MTLRAQPSLLKAKPLAALIRTRALRAGGVRRLAAEIDEDDGSIEQWVRATWIYAHTADRICIKLGTHPALLWPNEWTAYNQYERPSRAKPPKEPKHGTRWVYMQGCRCDACVTEQRTYRREYERKRRAKAKAA